MENNQNRACGNSDCSHIAFFFAKEKIKNDALQEENEGLKKENENLKRKIDKLMNSKTKQVLKKKVTKRFPRIFFFKKKKRTTKLYHLLWITFSPFFLI